MKTKKRFGELNIGETFEWGGKTLTKDGDRTAKSFSPKTDFVFSKKDSVIVDQIDEDEEDDDNSFFNGFGCISAQPVDIYDAYVRDDDLTTRDKCN